MYIHIIEFADRIDDSHEEPQTDKTLNFSLMSRVYALSLSKKCIRKVY